MGHNSRLRATIRRTSRSKTAGQDLALSASRRLSYIRFRRNSGTTNPTQQWKYMHTRIDHDTSCINVVVHYRCFLSVPFATLLGLINRMNMSEVTRLTVWGE
jgi:hypothetical protein